MAFRFFFEELNKCADLHKYERVERYWEMSYILKTSEHHAEDSGRLNLLMLAEYFENENHDVLAQYDEYHLFLDMYKVTYFEIFKLVCCVYKMQVVILQEEKIKI